MTRKWNRTKPPGSGSSSSSGSIWSPAFWLIFYARDAPPAVVPPEGSKNPTSQSKKWPIVNRNEAGGSSSSQSLDDPDVTYCP